MTDYFDNPAMSQSKLKDLKKSPKHFWIKHLSPDRRPQVETEAMKFGKALHMYLFEPQIFINKYVIEPEYNKRTKEGKTTYETFKNSHIGKIFICQDDMNMVKQMRDAILNKKISHLLLNNGLTEHEIYWTDRKSGVKCKAKLDYLIPPCVQFPHGAIIDLKTTVNAAKDEFNKGIYNFGYYNQAAFYSEAIKHIYDLEHHPLFIFIAVEKEPPFECNFFSLDLETFTIGKRENDKLLALYTNCVESGKWYGYEDRINSIGLPNWALNKFNFEE